MNSTPSRTPRDSGPPPPASVVTSITTPMAAMTSESTRVRRSCKTRPTLVGGPATGRDRALWRRGVDVDDHTARAAGEHGLGRLAEDRSAVARRQWHHDRLRAEFLGLADDQRAGSPGADL